MIKTWHEDMTDAETADLAYWERNVLALKYAEGWYNDDIDVYTDYYDQSSFELQLPTKRPRYWGWRRVLSLEGGSITFHIPNDFDVGNLPEITANWDGHTTEEKWRRVLAARGVTA